MELMTPEVRWDHNGGELIATKKSFKNLFPKPETTKDKKHSCGYVEKYVRENACLYLSTDI